MSEKIFSPGEIVEESGLYPVIGPDGDDKGYEVTVVQGEPFPPTPEKGWGFGTPRLAKTTHSHEGGIVRYSSPALPANRPIFRGNSALVPSETLPNGRPILRSDKKIASSDHLPLHRPVFQSDLNIVAMHGDRPVVRLKSALSPSSSLPENRPIAAQGSMPESNLMGYID